jgi:uncharacterized membrane protein
MAPAMGWGKSDFEKEGPVKKNMGNADKIIRTILAIVIVILFFTKVISGTLGWVLLALAVVFLLTSLFGVCPLYIPFGINTAKKQKP